LGTLPRRCGVERDGGRDLRHSHLKFDAELAKAIPASSCVGWYVDGKPDPDQLRKLGE
jgi:hypothetical protein